MSLLAYALHTARRRCYCLSAIRSAMGGHELHCFCDLQLILRHPECNTLNFNRIVVIIPYFLGVCWLKQLMYNRINRDNYAIYRKRSFGEIVCV